MRATKSLALLVLALGCGLVASFGITQVMSNREAANPETQTVLVATKDLAQGDVIAADAVKAEEWPKGKVSPGTLVRVEDAEGRRAVKFFAGEPILEQKLFVKGEGSGADSLIPKNYRVVSVRVDAVTIHGGLLMPGSRVDLQVYMTRNPALGIQETCTKTVLENIRVFAVNDVVNVDNTGPEAKSIQARTVSLLVTPRQAEKITLASELGTIRLVMRSRDDTEETNGKGMTAPELFGNVESGRPQKETLLLPDASTEKKEKEPLTQGFVDFLNSMRSKIAVEKAGPLLGEPKDSAHWRMTVLKGGEISEIDLEGDQLSSAESGSLAWRIHGPKSIIEVPKPAPTPTTEPAAQPEESKAKDEPRKSKEVPKPLKEKLKPQEKKPQDDTAPASPPGDGKKS